MLNSTGYNPYTAPLRIQAGFSRLGAALYSLLYLSSALVLSVSQLGMLGIGVGLLGLSMHAVYVLRYHLLYINHPLQGCVLHAHEVKLTPTQLHLDGELAADSYSTTWMVLLRVYLTQRLNTGHSMTRTHTMLVFADALDADTFRHLRVRLRHVKQRHELDKM